MPPGLGPAAARAAFQKRNGRWRQTSLAGQATSGKTTNPPKLLKEFRVALLHVSILNMGVGERRKNLNLSTPAVQARAWTSREAAYLHFVSDPEGFALIFAEQFGVRSQKLRWVLQQRGRMARALIEAAGPSAKAAQERYGALKRRRLEETAFADELIDMTKGRREEGRLLREHAGFPVYLAGLSAGFRALVSLGQPAPDPPPPGSHRVEISLTRELPRLLNRAERMLAAVLPSEAELIRLRPRLRFCALCTHAFVKRQQAQRYCPTCSRRWSRQQRWYRAGGQNYRPERKAAEGTAPDAPTSLPTSAPSRHTKVGGDHPRQGDCGLPQVSIWEEGGDRE